MYRHSIISKNFHSNDETDTGIVKIILSATATFVTKLSLFIILN